MSGSGVIASELATCLSDVHQVIRGVVVVVVLARDAAEAKVVTCRAQTGAAAMRSPVMSARTHVARDHSAHALNIPA